MQPRWRIAPPLSEELRHQFSKLHPVVLQLLANRGLVTQEAIDQFLVPNYTKDIHDPFLFREMERACERVWTAIEDGEKVVIHGDYDADGVTGSVVLMSTFHAIIKKLEKDPNLFSSYIPHREKEGYGVRMETIDLLAKDSTTLMITVDCGISCTKEIAHASVQGIDTIVVDHHQIPEKIPECIILHPLVPGETYPYKHLAAVGVAFKFASGFIAYAARHGCALEPGFEKWLLDLVAIATVTDFMPLIGENRTLEKYGLLVLNKTRRLGLRKLIDIAGLASKPLDTVSIGFYIGPRINAASRMEHARIAFSALMAESEEDATRYVDHLQRCNVDRQRYTEEIMIAAREKIQAMGKKKIYCILGEGWSAGIVGLVAGKLVSELGVPVFVFGEENGRMVGSGRSIPEFNVVTAMERAKDCIARFGGHPQACGLTIEGKENFQTFSVEVEKYAEEILVGLDLRPTLSIDASLVMSQVTWNLVQWLQKFEPHGEGNPQPRFLLTDLFLSAVDMIGKTKKTVRLGVRGDVPKETKIIGFNAVQKVEGLIPGMRVDAVVEIGINEWNGRKEIQLKMIDVRETVKEKVLATSV